MDTQVSDTVSDTKGVRISQGGPLEQQVEWPSRSAAGTLGVLTPMAPPAFSLS